MVLDIHEIKFLRRKLGITQSHLAKQAGVSQSLIAKVEAGTLDPTYSNAIKIFSVLDDFGRKNDKKAVEIMKEKIVSILPHTLIREAIAKMKRHGFSQLPVIADHKVLGLVSEANILNAILDKRGKFVEDIMESAPPVVSIDSSLPMISHLLTFFQLVVVSHKGKIVGVITKSDLLDKLYGH